MFRATGQCVDEAVRPTWPPPDLTNDTAADPKVHMGQPATDAAEGTVRIEPRLAVLSLLLCFLVTIFPFKFVPLLSPPLFVTLLP